MKYKVIDKSEAEEVVKLAVCLTNEIIGCFRGLALKIVLKALSELEV